MAGEDSGLEDCGFFDLDCRAENMAAESFGKAIDNLANAAVDAFGRTIGSVSSVWVRLGTPDLTGGGGTSAIDAGATPPGVSGVETALNYVVWVGLVVAILSLVALAALMAVRVRRGEGFMAVGRLGTVLTGVVMIGAASSLVAAIVPTGPSAELSRPVATIQSGLWWWMGAAAIFGVIIGGIRMAYEQRAQAGTDVLRGIVTLVLVAGAGVTVVSLLLEASDSFAVWLLDRSLDCDVTQDTECFGKGLFKLLGENIFLNGLTSVGPLLMIVIGLGGVIVSAIQIMLMVARGGLLVVLAGVLPLSAALTMTKSGSAWFQKVVGWTIALLLYKPAAAIIYATAFQLVADHGGDEDALLSALTGLMLMVLALVALPVLMKFVTPMVGPLTSGGGGGMLMAAAIPMGAMMLSGGRDGASGANGAQGVPGPSGAAGGAAAQGAGAAAGAASGAATGAAGAAIQVASGAGKAAKGAAENATGKGDE